MKYILITLLAGIVATPVRVLFLEALSKIRQVHVDMIKAIGTIHPSYF